MGKLNCQNHKKCRNFYLPNTDPSEAGKWLETHVPDYREIVAEEKEQATKKQDNSQRKVGMNDPCPCGSGKRFKNCCYKDDDKVKDDVQPIIDKLIEGKSYLLSKEDRHKVESLANNGNANAQYALGKSIGFYGKDENAALKWFLAAAENGHGSAKTELGKYYRMKRDYQKAIQWLEQSAAEGNPEAMQLLGNILYYNGYDGRDRQEKKGLEWLKKAAELKDPEALKFMVDYYINEGDIRNGAILSKFKLSKKYYEEALMWCRKDDVLLKG